jgi:hypothetical protein
MRYRSGTDCQFGTRLAFMQLLKASALLPAPADMAAWRSQSDASRLSAFAGLLSFAEGVLLLSYWPDGYGGGGTHPTKSIIVTSSLVFMHDPLLSILRAG